MTTETVLVLFNYVFIVISIVVLHEAIHWAFALLFRRDPTLKFEHFFTPVITYKNNQSDTQNLIISASAPLILFTVGLLIESDSGMLVMIKLMCLANFFNLLPVTADGQMILLSLLNMLKKKQT
ncbi:metalloprotease family protein [Sporosarcina sp. 6E9]|uniref:metalloprotease family protein n=1 Tax=Sporosarcina sp. 6E9 TaxID=2819235 RepID=UPI001B30C087|nr:metalloprotease family protein [Sporosarcina sp. 6E9]